MTSKGLCVFKLGSNCRVGWAAFCLRPFLTCYKSQTSHLRLCRTQYDGWLSLSVSRMPSTMVWYEILFLIKCYRIIIFKKEGN